MLFSKTALNGCYIVSLEKNGDERGFFSRYFCEEEFEKAGLESRFRQVNNSLNSQAGTLRGLHYQLPPHGEVKLVRCTSGSLYDVVLDLRPDSSTFGNSFGAELSAENRDMMYVPKGCAHGIMTLTDNAEVIYLVSDNYYPAAERGVRFDDPQFEIEWPRPVVVMSEKDKAWPDYDPQWHGSEVLQGLL